MCFCEERGSLGWVLAVKLKRFTGSGTKQGNLKLSKVKPFLCFANSYTSLIPPFSTESGFLPTLTFQVLTNILLFRVFIYINVPQTLFFLWEQSRRESCLAFLGLGPQKCWESWSEDCSFFFQFTSSSTRGENRLEINLAFSGKLICSASVENVLLCLLSF